MEISSIIVVKLMKGWVINDRSKLFKPYHCMIMIGCPVLSEIKLKISMIQVTLYIVEEL